MDILYLLNPGKGIWNIGLTFWVAFLGFLFGTKYEFKNIKKKYRDLLIFIFVALTLFLFFSFCSTFYPPAFNIYKDKVSERNCFFEIPRELIGRFLVPVYIQNNTEGTQIANISCRGEGFPVIPIYYEDSEGSSIREINLIEGNNGPFLISTDILHDRDECFLDFIVESQDKSIKKTIQKIKLINQPWKHFSRIFDNNWVNTGEKFKVEVCITNYGVSSNFHIAWELYKISFAPNEYPWVWKDGEDFLDAGIIEKNGTKNKFIGNEKNGENKYFQINEPGLYHIKTYTYKDFPPKLIFNEDDNRRTMENLKKYCKNPGGSENDLKIWQASDLHQMILVYVLPKEI